MNRILIIALFALTAIFAGFATGCGGDDVEVLECDGECTCDEQTRTCSCAGGTECTLDGAEDVTFECDGNASCDLACGTGCHVICPGTTGCTTILAHNASGECQGTATCEFSCEGNCDVDCGGNTDCTVECADDCELTDDLNCRC